MARSSVLALISRTFSPLPLDRRPGALEVVRCESSLAAWFSALSTSWWSTLLTMSKCCRPWCLLPVGCRARAGRTRRRARCGILPYRAPCDPSAVGATAGGLPERPMGADCKSVGLAFEGSNPSPATLTEARPPDAPSRPGADACPVAPGPDARLGERLARQRRRRPRPPRRRRPGRQGASAPRDPTSAGCPRAPASPLRARRRRPPRAPARSPA